MSHEAQVVSITEAAERLGVSVRTVQRRLDTGELEAVTERDKRRVILPGNATAPTTTGTPERDSECSAQLNYSGTLGDSDTPTRATRDTPQRDSDATRELLEQLRGERDRLVEQLERAQDDAAQWRAMAAQLMSSRALLQSSLTDTQPEAVEGDLSAPKATAAQVSEVPEIVLETATNRQRQPDSKHLERSRGFRAWLLKTLRG
jgi:excisionase family DNA binding protein